MRRGGGRREDRPKTKLIVRHLPPELTEHAFRAAVNAACPYPWEEDLEWFYFVEGQSDRGEIVLGRAYVHFVKPSALFDFSDALNGRVFTDSKGSEYVALVEYSANQKLPRVGKSKGDSKDGTIDADMSYKNFVDQLLNPPALEAAKVPVATEPEDAAFKDSPLLAELRIKIQEKRRRAARKEAERKERERERERERARRDKERAAKERAVKEKERAARDKERSRKDERKDDKNATRKSVVDGVPLPRPATSGDGRGKGAKEKGSNHVEKESKSGRNEGKTSRDGKSSKHDSSETSWARKERPERAVYVPKPRAQPEGNGSGGKLEHGIIRIAKPPVGAPGSSKTANSGSQGVGAPPAPKPKDEVSSSAKGGESKKGSDSRRNVQESRKTGEGKTGKGDQESGKGGSKKRKNGKAVQRGGRAGVNDADGAPVPQYQNFLDL